MPPIFDTKYNVEVVKLQPHFQLPPGIELIPGVIVVEKPLWLHTSNWVELVKFDLRRLEFLQSSSIFLKLFVIIVPVVALRPSWSKH